MQVEKEREKEVSDDEAEAEEKEDDEETPKVCTLYIVHCTKQVVLSTFYVIQFT